MATKAYLGLGRVISIILAIFPLTNVILGIVERVQKGKILGAVLNFFLFFIFYFVDLVTVILWGKLELLA